DVPITDDVSVEGLETVALSLSSATLGAPSAATLNIVDDDQPAAQSGTLQFFSDTFNVTESMGPAVIGVTRTGGSDGVVSATVSTSDGSASSASDYRSTEQVLTWADGDSSMKTVDVPITDDVSVEGVETV